MTAGNLSNAPAKIVAKFMGPINWDILKIRVRRDGKKFKAKLKWSNKNIKSHIIFKNHILFNRWPLQFKFI